MLYLLAFYYNHAVAKMVEKGWRFQQHGLCGMQVEKEKNIEKIAYCLWAF